MSAPKRPCCTVRWMLPAEEPGVSRPRGPIADWSLGASVRGSGSNSAKCGSQPLFHLLDAATKDVDAMLSARDTKYALLRGLIV